MRRPDTLPTFDDPPIDARAVRYDLWSYRQTVACALFAYALAAVNLWGPPACSTQALTPACFAVLEAAW